MKSTFKCEHRAHAATGREAMIQGEKKNKTNYLTSVVINLKIGDNYYVAEAIRGRRG